MEILCKIEGHKSLHFIQRFSFENIQTNCDENPMKSPEEAISITRRTPHDTG